MRLKRKPAFFMAAAMSIGIISSYVLISFELIFLLKILVIIGIFYFCLYILYQTKITKNTIYICLIIFFFLLGLFLYSYQEYKYRSKYSISNFTASESVQILGKIYFDIGDLESTTVYLKPYYINNKKFKYGKVIFNSKKIKEFNDGDLIALDLELSVPESALNPGSFSYLDYLKKEEVYLKGWNPKNIKRLKQNRSLKNIIIKCKKVLLKNINYLFTEEKAAFIKAILLGEREYLSYQQKSLLRQAGASHLLAISGLHMGIIILSFSFIFFKICSKKKNALYLITILTLFYIIMVGAAVSIIRAALLALLFLWSDEFRREGDFLNIISLTLLINLILKPSALFTVSLQLSYILVLALFYLSPLLSRYLPVIFAVSLSAQLASLPISAYYFNEYAWIALITNLWLIPYITFLLPFIFILILGSLFSLSILKAFTILAEIGLDLLFKGLKLMTSIQGRSLVIAEPDLIFIFLYYIFLFMLPFIFYKRYIYVKAKKFLFWKKTVPLILILILLSFFINKVPKNLVISFIAVGQGDGIFIQFPNGKNMLVDTGPPGNKGRNIEYSIISYLNYLGIRDIDYLMISHFDADHAGGISHLLQRKQVKNILIPPFKEKTELHNQLETAKNNYFNLNYLTAGISFKISECTLKILNPKTNNLNLDRNENSIVFLLTYKNRKFLFTGDLSKKGETRIVNDYNIKNIDVLKAGHHGSKTSSGEVLLDAINPQLAVISVGRNNFGHPSAEVLERFKQKSIKYLRTDQSGLIKIVSNGESVFFNTFR